MTVEVLRVGLTFGERRPVNLPSVESDENQPPAEGMFSEASLSKAG